MRLLSILALLVVGGLGYLILAPSHPVTPTRPAAPATPTSNRAAIAALKRQLAEEQEALARSVYNRARTSGDVTKGTDADSSENRARRVKIRDLQNRISALEQGGR